MNYELTKSGGPQNKTLPLSGQNKETDGTFKFVSDPKAL